MWRDIYKRITGAELTSLDGALGPTFPRRNINNCLSEIEEGNYMILGETTAVTILYFISYDLLPI